MSSLTAIATVAGTAIAGLSGVILLKHFTITDRVEHLVMAFAAYAFSNCLMLSVLS